jgi:hypothetical protein
MQQTQPSWAAIPVQTLTKWTLTWRVLETILNLFPYSLKFVKININLGVIETNLYSIQSEKVVGELVQLCTKLY